ncbi:MAG: hypothetical protein K2Y13_11480 [Burkholderiaceae bacterium]|uniref:hypothetical protein n=1 Tax=Herminiimonas sp. Marseille-P9896 TaxID=2742211 RepID=UPI00158EE4C5|nr:MULTISPECIES: hypothetical protein [Oxalobacteraceae]MBX9800068.1 hypothetical protein [Burkholderiaceae bacterium]
MVTSASRYFDGLVRNEARKNLPSIFTVRVLGFGNEDGEMPRRNDEGNKKPTAYDPNGAVEVLGQMDLSEKQLRQLTETERRNLRR